MADLPLTSDGETLDSWRLLELLKPLEAYTRHLAIEKPICYGLTVCPAASLPYGICLAVASMSCSSVLQPTAKSRKAQMYALGQALVLLYLESSMLEAGFDWNVGNCKHNEYGPYVPRRRHPYAAGPGACVQTDTVRLTKKIVSAMDKEQQEHQTEEPSPEAQARVAQLMEILQDNPAITCPITFNWQGNQELAENASLKIRLYGVFLRESQPSADFSSLKAITFHHDYELALKEASGRGDEGPQPTKEAGGFSVGMLVHTPDGAHLVMHEGVALALASEDQEQRDWAEHIVRHELCHVIDYGFKSELIRSKPDKATYKGFDSFMAPLAEALWDEFFANKYSHGPWSNPRTFLDLLKDVVPPAKADVTNAILEYRTKGELQSLLNFAKPKVKFVAQCFGYAAGTLAAMGTTMAQFAPDVLLVLEQQGLSQAWGECFEAVQALDARRPGWESVLELRALFPGCVTLYKSFGLHYSPRGEGAYVDVPMTRETNPTLVAFNRLIDTFSGPGIK